MASIFKMLFIQNGFWRSLFDVARVNQFSSRSARKNKNSVRKNKKEKKCACGVYVPFIRFCALFIST